METVRAETHACRRDGGASVVEYALVFSVLLAGSVGVFNTLTQAATSQANNQAHCVSERPAPVECQKRPAIVATTTRSPATTTTTPPGTTGPGQTSTTQPPATTTTTAPAPAIAGFVADAITGPRPGVRITVRLTSGSEPVAGATVQVRLTVTAPGDTREVTLTCTTDATGACLVNGNPIEYVAPYDDTTGIAVALTSIDANPPAAALPAGTTVTF